MLLQLQWAELIDNESHELVHITIQRHINPTILGGMTYNLQRWNPMPFGLNIYEWFRYLSNKDTFNSKSHVCVDASISKATCTFHKWWGPHIPDIDYKAFKCSIFLQESTTETWTSITVNKHIEGLGYDKC